MLSIELLQNLQPLFFAHIRYELGILRWKQIGDRVFCARPNKSSLMCCRQESSRPVTRPVRTKPPRVWQHDKGRQILVQASQAIRHPRAKVRKAGKHKTSVLHERGGTVDVRLGDHRM